ncbi:hypothetical protein PIB30_096158, partial [Stylosanthes scabra]|nr:hypothetical protein [Stylosanthes scabra]
MQAQKNSFDTKLYLKNRSVVLIVSSVSSNNACNNYDLSSDKHELRQWRSKLDQAWLQHPSPSAALATSEASGNVND